MSKRHLSFPPYITSAPGVLFALLVFFLALGNLWTGLYPYGWAVWVRPLLSLTGMAGAVLLILRNRWWMVLLPLWCLAQTWVIATDVSREWFYQGIMVGQASIDSVRFNNVLGAYRSSGVNYAGLILLFIINVIIALQLHPPTRTEITRRSVAVVASCFAAAILGILWLGGARFSPAPDGAITIDLDLPHVPLYYKHVLVGTTPLTITPERVRELQLPLNPNATLKAYSPGWCDAVVLTDGTTHLPLYAAPPGLFAQYLDTFPTPYGERCRIHVGRQSDDGRHLSGAAFPRPELRDEPVLNVALLNTLPIREGEPIKVRCTLNNPTSRTYTGRKSVIQRLMFPHDQRQPNEPFPANFRREFEMPSAWSTIAPATALTADLEFDSRALAGSHEFFCTWFLFDEKPDSNTGTASVYSNILDVQITPASAGPDLPHP